MSGAPPVPVERMRTQDIVIGSGAGGAITAATGAPTAGGTAASQPFSTYSKKVKIGEDHLFFVAMGDAELGYSISSGNIEILETDDKFHEGFYCQK